MQQIPYIVPTPSLLLFLFSILFAPSHPQSQTNLLARWVDRAPMPFARAETGATIVGYKIYVLGGFENALTPKSDVMVYYRSTDQWSTEVPLPIALHHLGVTAIGDDLYVMGGVKTGLEGRHPNGSDWTGTTTALKFNTITQQWDTVKALPHATAASGVVAYADKVYVIGGVDADGQAINLVQIYNPKTNSWSSGSLMPTKREHVGITLLDKTIYVVSGRVGEMSFNILEAYSPEQDQWTSLPGMSAARSDLAFGISHGRLYAMGGEKPGIFDVNEEYDPVLKSWKTVQKMTGFRKAFPAVSINDSIFVFGGVTESNWTAKVEIFLPAFSPVNAIRKELRDYESRLSNSYLINSHHKNSKLKNSGQLKLDPPQKEFRNRFWNLLGSPFP